jgi:hypothetical protein
MWIGARAHGAAGCSRLAVIRGEQRPARGVECMLFGEGAAVAQLGDLRRVTVHVGELEGLMIDKHQDALFRRQ